MKTLSLIFLAVVFIVGAFAVVDNAQESVPRSAPLVDWQIFYSDENGFEYSTQVQAANINQAIGNFEANFPTKYYRIRSAARIEFVSCQSIYNPPEPQPVKK